MHTNIYNEKLIPCSSNPMTGFYRNGDCDSGDDDTFVHSVCVVVTKDFLEFSKNIGNDLITPHPEWSFPGLIPGDRWCLCASRWVEAWKAGVAPLVVLEATHEKTLEFVPLEQLIKYAFRDNLLENEQ